MSSPIPENAAPPPVAGTPETTPGGVKESKEKNRGWPKGKKRYPKSPGAPKQPLSGKHSTNTFLQKLFNYYHQFT